MGHITARYWGYLTHPTVFARPSRSSRWRMCSNPAVCTCNHIGSSRLGRPAKAFPSSDVSGVSDSFSKSLTVCCRAGVSSACSPASAAASLACSLHLDSLRRAVCCMKRRDKPMAYIVLACIVLACIVMACIVMAYIVMAYIVLACIVMACMVMACIVMAYIVMA